MRPMRHLKNTKRIASTEQSQLKEELQIKADAAIATILSLQSTFRGEKH